MNKIGNWKKKKRMEIDAQSNPVSIKAIKFMAEILNSFSQDHE